MLSLTAAAQSPVPLDTLPFVQYESDTLAFDPATSDLPAFFRKMDEMTAQSAQ